MKMKICWMLAGGTIDFEDTSGSIADLMAQNGSVVKAENKATIQGNLIQFEDGKTAPLTPPIQGMLTAEAQDQFSQLTTHTGDSPLNGRDWAILARFNDWVVE